MPRGHAALAAGGAPPGGACRSLHTHTHTHTHTLATPHLTVVSVRLMLWAIPQADMPTTARDRAKKKAQKALCQKPRPCGGWPG